LLPAGMEITSYNHHLRRLLSSQRLWSSNQDYRVNRAFALIQSILVAVYATGWGFRLYLTTRESREEY
jgi:hypothetical protein